METLVLDTLGKLYHHGHGRSVGAPTAGPLRDIGKT